MLKIDTIKTHINYYLRELNWYHFGNKILNSTKYIVSNDNKTLVIINITDKDIGEYSVRFDGLRLYHYNRDCEHKILKLLRNYPVLKPVYFILSTKGKHCCHLCGVKFFLGVTVIEKISPNYPYGVTLFNNKTPKVTLTSYLKDYCNEGSLSLYHNGNLLFSGVTSGILDSAFNPHYNYTITHPVITDSGYYEFQFFLDLSSVLSTLNCPGSYQNFLHSFSYLGLPYVVLDMDMQNLEYVIG